MYAIVERENRNTASKFTQIPKPKQIEKCCRSED